jgi:hypothetical protein
VAKTVVRRVGKEVLQKRAQNAMGLCLLDKFLCQMCAWSNKRLPPITPLDGVSRKRHPIRDV